MVETKADATATPKNRDDRLGTIALHTVHDLTRDEMLELGRTLRKQTPRSSHAVWEPPATGRDPVAILEQSNLTRVPELVPIRYGRMLASPFTYLRGSPAVMAADLARTPRSGVTVQACGDAHLLNFGIYGSPERRLIFDLNDFDETTPGPFEWDVKRLAVSVVVAARSTGLGDKTATRATRECVRLYRETMATLAGTPPLDIWYSHLDTEQIVAMAQNAQARRLARRVSAKARTRDTMQALAKLTDVVDGRRRIIDDPPLIEHDARGDEVIEDLRRMYALYCETLQADRLQLLSQYRFVDAARKVVGVGSVGTRCWIVLGGAVVDGSPMWLQLKQAEESVLAPHLEASKYTNQGERVVSGQRLLQSVSDIFLGWAKSEDFDFYVRQLRDMKGSVDLANVTDIELVGYARLCGTTLARAHARTGLSPVIAGYLGTSNTFDRAIGEFALAYTEQNRRDYETLAEAEKSGRIEVIRGR